MVLDIASRQTKDSFKTLNSANDTFKFCSHSISNILKLSLLVFSKTLSMVFKLSKYSN